MLLGLHFLLVTASARFFVPALRPASGRAASVPLLHSRPQSRPREYRRSAPRVAPVVASALDGDEWILTASFFAGLVAGLAVLILGVTSASKAIRSGRKGGAWVSVLKCGALPAVKRDPMAAAFPKKISLKYFSDASLFTFGDGDMADPLRPLKLEIKVKDWQRDSEWDDEFDFDGGAKEWGRG